MNHDNYKLKKKLHKKKPYPIFFSFLLSCNFFLLCLWPIVPFLEEEEKKNEQKRIFFIFFGYD